MDRVSLAKEEKEVRFFSSGSTLLDLALGGGWALSRVFNIVGDKSTGKTGNAVEAFANFKVKFSKGRMRYAEAESAFDVSFAQQLGFPDEVERPEKMIHTVEEFSDDVYKFTKQGGPGLYILDSLDALASDSEIERQKARIEGKKEKGSMGAEKAKDMSEMFRLLVQEMDAQECTLGIISQMRDKIGVMFGETKGRSGGRALDFYASQVLWLSETGKIEHSSNNQKRVTAISVHSKVKKNKVGFPFREADYDLILGFGIDDENSMIDWLLITKTLVKEAAEDLRDQVEKARETLDYKKIKEINQQLKQDCTNLWQKIEKNLAPPMRKYEHIDNAIQGQRKKE